MWTQDVCLRASNPSIGDSFCLVSDVSILRDRRAFFRDRITRHFTSFPWQLKRISFGKNQTSATETPRIDGGRHQHLKHLVQRSFSEDLQSPSRSETETRFVYYSQPKKTKSIEQHSFTNTVSVINQLMEINRTVCRTRQKRFFRRHLSPTT